MNCVESTNKTMAHQIVRLEADGDQALAERRTKRGPLLAGQSVPPPAPLWPLTTVQQLVPSESDLYSSTPLRWPLCTLDCHCAPQLGTLPFTNLSTSLLLLYCPLPSSHDPRDQAALA